VLLAPVALLEIRAQDQLSEAVGSCADLTQTAGSALIQTKIQGSLSLSQRTSNDSSWIPDSVAHAAGSVADAASSAWDTVSSAVTNSSNASAGALTNTSNPSSSMLGSVADAASSAWEAVTSAVSGEDGSSKGGSTTSSPEVTSTGRSSDGVENASNASVVGSMEDAASSAWEAVSSAVSGSSSEASTTRLPRVISTSCKTKTDPSVETAWSAIRSQDGTACIF
ncbi:unnamed protein product, partial [Polarella glacialis]